MAIDLVQEFWRRTARTEFALPRCPDCSRPRWYPTYFCSVCGSQQPSVWEEASHTATLWSWTVVRRTFLPQFADAVPFVVAIVELDTPEGIRLVTRIVEVDPEDLAIGMKLKLTFLEDSDGAKLPVFRPLDYSEALSSGEGLT